MEEKTEIDKAINHKAEDTQTGSTPEGHHKVNGLEKTSPKVINKQADKPAVNADVNENDTDKTVNKGDAKIDEADAKTSLDDKTRNATKTNNININKGLYKSVEIINKSNTEVKTNKVITEVNRINTDLMKSTDDVRIVSQFERMADMSKSCVEVNQVSLERGDGIRKEKERSRSSSNEISDTRVSSEVNRIESRSRSVDGKDR